MDVIDMELKDIKPYENNPRNNREAVEKVMKSIEEFGFQVPIVVDKNHVIIAGHTRFLAARELGFHKVPVVVADKLSEAKVKAFRLADNKVSEFSSWDFSKLIEELAGIDCYEEIDMTQFGFEEMLDDDDLIEDIFEEASPVNEDSEDKKKQIITCPHCGMDFEI